MGILPDHRRAIRGARQQPRTDVAGANRGHASSPGLVLQERTGEIQQLHPTPVPRVIKRNSYLHLGTYNTRTINDENLDILLFELNNIKWDIIGLAETKVKESDITILEGKGHKLFTSGNGETKRNGTGFLVHTNIVDSVVGSDEISDRLSILKLQGPNCKIIVVQVYFPTTSHDTSEVEELYDQIQNIFDNSSKRDIFFLLGDFNAKIGGLDSVYPNSIGKYTIGTHNDRGLLLGDFCTRNDLVVTNTLFQKKAKNLWTWASPDKKTRNQIDFIITKSANKHLVHDSAILKSPDISDHRLIRCKVKIKLRKPPPPPKTNLFDFTNINDNTIQSNFQLKLQNRFEALQTLNDTETLNTAITNALIETAQETIPAVKRTTHNWLSITTKNAIKNKHKIRQQYGITCVQYRIAKAETKKLVKKDKLDNIEKECDNLSNIPPDKQFFAAVKKLKRKQKTLGWGIKKADGSLATDKDEILSTWASFYQDLYNDISSDPDYNIQCDTELEIPPILLSELDYGVKNLKSGKAPGIDNVFSELIKLGGDPLKHALLKLLNLIISTFKIPSNFQQSIIVLIFKKGDRFQCKNYRPISLLSHIYKLFMSIITNRIKNDLYSSFPASQAAYQPGRGTI